METGPFIKSRARGGARQLTELASTALGSALPTAAFGGMVVRKARTQAA